MADVVQPPARDEAAPIVDAPIDPSTPLFRVRPFRLLFITRVASTTAVQMLAVVVGWHVYELTDSALQLGMIGLVQVLPPLLLMLAAGQVADRYNPGLVLRCCSAGGVCSSGGFGVGGCPPAAQHRGDLCAALGQCQRAGVRAAGDAGPGPGHGAARGAQPRHRGPCLGPAALGPDRAFAR